MRRTERLFQIIQILRGATRPVTAQQLSEELETSVRTIYRDIAELIAQRVPVKGEAGIGYVLGRGYDMPPLMLTPDELEVVVLGAQWVKAQGDSALQRSARDLVNKIVEVVPAELRPHILNATSIAVPGRQANEEVVNMEQLREAIRSQRKLHLYYTNLNESSSERVVWPIAIAYFDTARLLAAWCELREDFRHFRTDRISRMHLLEETYPGSRSQLHQRWVAAERAQRQRTSA